MIARLAALVFAVCLATSAQAQTLWSTPASACVPSDRTIKNDRHLTGNASVQHAPDNMDPIILTCPITAFSDANTFWELAVGYQSVAQTTLTARLYRMALGSGSATPVRLEMVNASDSSGAFNSTSGAGFTHPFDFSANTYWVRVQMDRTATDQTVILHFLHLYVD
jgi:hypothetical protein